MQWTCGSSLKLGVASARMVLHFVGETCVGLVILMLGCGALLSASPRRRFWKQKKRRNTCQVRNFGLLYLVLITCVPVVSVGGVVYGNMLPRMTAPAPLAQELYYCASTWQVYSGSALCI